MSFLAKLGGIVVKGLAIATGLAPILSQHIPGSAGTVTEAVGTFTKIAGIIMQVEAIGQALGIKGPDKLKAAAPLVAQAVLSSTLMVGKKIANEVLFNEGCVKVADGVVAIMNSIRTEDAKEESKKA